MDALFGQHETRAGKAHMISKIETSPWVTAPGQHEEGALRWCFYGCNILGDPLTSLWTDEPFDYEVDYPLSVAPGTTSVTISVTSDGSGVSGMCCSLLSEGELLGTGTTDESGQAVINLAGGAPASGMDLVVTGANALPQEYLISVSVGVEESRSEISITISPNPADDLVTLKISSVISTGGTITIYRMTGGQPVFESYFQANNANRHNLSIRTSDWMPGVYVCRIKTETAEKISKLVVRH
jgi:hypothetical protein